MTHIERAAMRKAMSGILALLLILVQHATGYKDINQYYESELNEPFTMIRDARRMFES